jgi:hypothetical protein
MHARPVRQRGLNRAGDKLLGRGVLLLLACSDGPRNCRSLLEGPLLQAERVGTEYNEAQRRAHELKYDACSYRLARFERSCAMWRNTRCPSVSRARTSPTISWHVERTPLNVRAGAGGCVSSSSCSRNALSRARESEGARTDLSVCTPLCAPQEVARTLSASPPSTQRAGAREIRARTPRGASGRASGG